MTDSLIDKWVKYCMARAYKDRTHAAIGLYSELGHETGILSEQQRVQNTNNSGVKGSALFTLTRSRVLRDGEEM